MKGLNHPLKTALTCYLSAFLCLLVCQGRAAAQSTALDLPTPVTSNSIEGRIAPLDLGDARLTRHFYAFGAARGDLLINVESANLEGDVDLFTAGSLRPLAKITLFSLSDAQKVARTIFLRADEQLILRVQARSPNDEVGAYRIRFGGSFVAASTPAGTEAQTADNALPASPQTPDRSVRRVSSVGARLEEPPPPPSETAASVEKEEDPSSPPTVEKKAPRKTSSAKPPSSRRNTVRTKPTKKDSSSTETASVDRDETTVADAAKRDSEDAARDERAATAAEERPAPPKPASKKTTRANRNRVKTRPPTAAKTEEPSAEPAAEQQIALPQPDARLIVHLKDGTVVEHQMSTVRRVTIEKGMLVVILNNGKTERQRMSGVLRMAIEP